MKKMKIVRKMKETKVMKVREAQLLRAMQQSVEQQPEPETAERSVTDHDVDTRSLRIVL